MSSSTSYSLKKNDLNKLVYPDMAYIDTCYLLEMDSAYSNYYQRECKNFFTNASDAGTLFAISGHVLNELEHSIIRAKYAEVAKKEKITSDEGKAPWQVLFDKDPSYMDTVDKEMGRIIEVIKENQILTLDYESDEKHRLLVRAISIIYGLDSYDAMHVSIMLQYEINSIATLDPHFLRVEGLNVYGPSKDIVSNSNTTDNPYIEFNSKIVKDIIENYQKRTFLVGK